MLRWIYYILDLFTNNPVFFKYDNSIQRLNAEICSRKNWFWAFYFIFLLQLLAGTVGPFLFSHLDELFDKPGRGISWTSHGLFYLFISSTTLLENLLFRGVSSRIQHLVPQFSYMNFRIFNWVVSRFVEDKCCFDYRTVFNFKDLVLSVISRSNSFLDAYFCVICVQSEQYTLFYISAVTIALSVLTRFFRLALFFAQKRQEQQLEILGDQITNLCSICSITEFTAVSKILDIVAPYNVIQILQFSINTQLLFTFIKFFFEDIPQIVI